MLDEAAALEHRNLRQVVSNMDAHEVAAERPAVPFLASAPCDQFRVDLFGSALRSTLATTVRSPTRTPLALAVAATTPPAPAATAPPAAWTIPVRLAIAISVPSTTGLLTPATWAIA